MSSAINTTICTLIAKNIYQVRLPLPFALNHVNCYLLQDDDGWTMLDTGLIEITRDFVWLGNAAPWAQFCNNCCGFSRRSIRTAG